MEEQTVATSAPAASLEAFNGSANSEEQVPVTAASAMDYGHALQQPPMPYMSYHPGLPILCSDPMYCTAATAALQNCGPMQMLPDAFYFMQYQQQMAAAYGLPPPPPLQSHQPPNAKNQQQQYLVNPYLHPPPPMPCYPYCCPAVTPMHYQQQPPAIANGADLPGESPQQQPLLMSSASSPPASQQQQAPLMQPLVQVPISMPPPPLQTPLYNGNGCHGYAGYSDYQLYSYPQQHQQQQQEDRPEAGSDSLDHQLHQPRYSNNRPQSVPAASGCSAARGPQFQQQQQKPQQQQQQHQQQHQLPNQQQPFSMTPRRKNGYMHNILYKTELCRDVLEKGTCPRGKTCQFAHSPAELHDPRKHPLYKTAFCFDYKNRSFCPRGQHCFHVHDVSELKMPPPFSPQSQQQPALVATAVCSVTANGAGTPRSSRAGRLRRRNVQQQQQHNKPHQKHDASSVEATPKDVEVAEPPSMDCSGAPSSAAEVPFNSLMKKLETSKQPLSDSSDGKRSPKMPAAAVGIEEKTGAIRLDDTWALEPVRGAQ